jgi:hypothetical protein
MDDLELTRDSRIQIEGRLITNGRWIVTTTNLDRRTGDKTQRCERYVTSRAGRRLLSVEEERTRHKGKTRLIDWKRTIVQSGYPDTVVAHTLTTEWPALSIARKQDRLNTIVPSTYHDLETGAKLNFKEFKHRERTQRKQEKLKRAARDS